MHWIKEVEMVESVDDLKSSPSIRGIPGPNFELLDATVASALNKIIQNSRFKVSLEEMKVHKRPLPPRKTDRFLDYEYFRVTGANDSVMPTHLQLFFEMTIFRKLTQSGMQFFLTQIHLMTSWKDCTN